ncbi:hypothetical protein [Couchioplanes caeruleus]|uniref:hypothetical protein n=1 Tax=Couchioplanes caeruleus TaxID=56438 RepID=UPI000F4AF91C
MVIRTWRTVQPSPTATPPPVLVVAPGMLRKSQSSPGRPGMSVGIGAPAPVRQLPLTVRSEAIWVLPGASTSLCRMMVLYCRFDGVLGSIRRTVWVIPAPRRLTYGGNLRSPMGFGSEPQRRLKRGAGSALLRRFPRGDAQRP